MNGFKFDPSHLTDGLKAEREQGITIDVAYRYFSTPRRKFIIADTPGHEQYTRNMVTGASTAHLAILLVDARKGILIQTRRHAYIAWLLGIRNIIVAVNKMDLVGFDPEVFARIRQSFMEFASPMRLQEIEFIPMSALEGDNVIARSGKMPWYEGRPLLETLESIQIHENDSSATFRFPVQMVIRSGQDFRGYAGTIASGDLQPNAEVLALPSGRQATIDRILNYKEDLDHAFAPMSVIVSLRQHIDLGRGDMLCDPQRRPSAVKTFPGKAHLDVDLAYESQRALFAQAHDANGVHERGETAAQDRSGYIESDSRRTRCNAMKSAKRKLKPINPFCAIHTRSTRPAEASLLSIPFPTLHWPQASFPIRSRKTRPR